MSSRSHIKIFTYFFLFSYIFPAVSTAQQTDISDKSTCPSLTSVPVPAPAPRISKWIQTYNASCGASTVMSMLWEKNIIPEMSNELESCIYDQLGLTNVELWKLYWAMQKPQNKIPRLQTDDYKYWKALCNSIPKFMAGENINGFRINLPARIIDYVHGCDLNVTLWSNSESLESFETLYADRGLKILFKWHKETMAHLRKKHLTFMEEKHETLSMPVLMNKLDQGSNFILLVLLHDDKEFITHYLLLRKNPLYSSSSDPTAKRFSMYDPSSNAGFTLNLDRFDVQILLTHRPDWKAENTLGYFQFLDLMLEINDRSGASAKATAETH